MCKYWPNTCLCFSICANTDANTLTNTSPIQSNTDLYRLKYRPIQAPQTNAHIIVFNDVIAVISWIFIIACLYAMSFHHCLFICQYRHQYCQIRRQQRTLFYCCVRGSWAFQAVHCLTPLGRLHTVPLCSETAELSTQQQISQALIRQNVASSPSAWSPE